MDSFEKTATFIKAGYNPKASHIKGYHIVNELSTPDAVVYESANNIVIVYPGTRWTRHHVFSDVASDVRIGLGQQGPRWKQAERVAHSTLLRFPKKHVHVYGHSLGGTLAMHVSDRTGLPTTVVNPGVVSGGVHKDKDYSNVTAYVNPNDPIAAGTSDISNKTGLNIQTLSSKHEDFWTKGGILGYLNKHKVLKYGLEAAGAVVGAGIAIATGGAAIPEEIAAFEGLEVATATAEELTPLLENTGEAVESIANIAEDATETTPLLEPPVETATSSSSSSSALSSKVASGVKGAVQGAVVTDTIVNDTDKAGKVINGALNHHSPYASSSGNKSEPPPQNDTQTTPTAASYVQQTSNTPAPRSTLTAYTLQGYSKVSHDNDVTGTSLMSVYSRKKYRKEKVRRTR